MPEQDSSLAADLRVQVLRLELIDRAKGNGATWAVIGRALGGISGREAKKRAHKLREQVKQAAAGAGGGEVRAASSPGGGRQRCSPGSGTTLSSST